MGYPMQKGDASGEHFLLGFGSPGVPRGGIGNEGSSQSQLAPMSALLP